MKLKELAQLAQEAGYHQLDTLAYLHEVEGASYVICKWRGKTICGHLVSIDTDYLYPHLDWVMDSSYDHDMVDKLKIVVPVSPEEHPDAEFFWE